MLASPKNLQVQYLDTDLRFLLFHDKDAPTFVMYQNNGIKSTSLIFRAPVRVSALSAVGVERVEAISDKWAQHMGENPQRRLMHIEVDLYADELDYEARVLMFLREKFPNDNFYARFIEFIKFPLSKLASLRDQASASAWNQNLGPPDSAVIAQRTAFVNRLHEYQQNTGAQYLYLLITQRPYTHIITVRPQFNSVTYSDIETGDYAALRYNMNNMNTYLAYMRTLRDFLRVAEKLQSVSLSYGGFFPLVIRYAPGDKSGNLVTAPDLRRGGRPERETYAELNRDGCNTVFLRNWRRACLFNVKEYIEQTHFLKYCGSLEAPKNLDGLEMMLLFARYQTLPIARVIVASFPVRQVFGGTKQDNRALENAQAIEKRGDMNLRFDYAEALKNATLTVSAIEQTLREQQQRREQRQQREALSSTNLLTPTKYFSGLRKNSE